MMDHGAQLEVAFEALDLTDPEIRAGLDLYNAIRQAQDAVELSCPTAERLERAFRELGRLHRRLFRSNR